MQRIFKANNNQRGFLALFSAVIVNLSNNCNCDYILFTKSPWPGNSEITNDILSK